MTRTTHNSPLPQSTTGMENVAIWLEDCSPSLNEDPVLTTDDQEILCPIHIVTPPSSDLASTPSRGRKRKRSSSVEDMAPFPSKKRDRREMSKISQDQATSVTNPSERPILSATSRSQTTSPIRSPSPTRKLLKFLRAAEPTRVYCDEQDPSMPPPAQKLRTRLAKRFGEELIPPILKVSTESPRTRSC